MTSAVLAASGGVKQVICISWGTKYGAPFINRLYAMVKRNITPPFTFTCFTDSRANLNPEILCEDLPPLDVENMPVRTKGIWPKARLWGPKLGNLSGPVLFLDLDLVIVGSLDAFFEVGGPDDVVLSRNQTTPFERLGQTSLFRFPVGKLVPLQEKFRADPQGVADKYEFEQRFVTRNAPGGANFFPRRWVLHFKQDCCWPFPLHYFLTPRLPADARVILFPRDFHPQFAVEGRFGLKGRAAPPLDHIRHMFDPEWRRNKSLFRYLRHYIRPTPWVADHWRE
ncbi:glycosyl transferase [Rhizobium sp. R72]|uniref:glycosyl transferase n=1 Tax=unclassified Rhizobium TaxID=2613769 RepID=UPI000B52C2E1|nr:MULTISPECIES: glycosyl transferase [unclassified Rhizobium]OWV98399.1 glycosyl transferase [Rhizobium sp. R693]OWW03637.1 glycosyl transferase [Rhizobium sp. R72]OWW03844.1 glycosyl transferase [Rhizobium sp. R711]